MFKSSTTLSTILLVILATTRASAAGNSEFDYTTKAKNLKMTTQDAISMSIREVHETEQFVQFMLNLIRTEPCFKGLTQDLYDMKSTLQTLTDLKPINLISNSKSLENFMTHIIQMGQRCSHSMTNVDMIVPSMLTRKIDDLSMVINNVVYQGWVMNNMGYGRKS